MPEDTIRVLRVLEYVGPRSVIEQHLKGVVHGERQIGASTLAGSHDPSGKAVVRAATLGLVPDILEVGKVEELFPLNAGACSIDHSKYVGKCPGCHAKLPNLQSPS